MTMPDPTPDPAVLSDARALTPETVAAAIKATEYKYFGDYEMSDDQREAVDVLVEVARQFYTPPASDAAVPAGEGANWRVVTNLARAPMKTRDEMRTALSLIASTADKALAAASHKPASDTRAGLLSYGYMRSGGRCDWRQLREAVSEAMRGTRDVEPDERSDIYTGHRMVERINYNSLDRIVTAFVDAALAIYATALPADVRRLVIAARVVAFEDDDPEAKQELVDASEMFADRVPWEDEPDTDATDGATGGGEGQHGGKLGWDVDGMCDDHYRFGCTECALPATTPGGDLLEQAAREDADVVERRAALALATCHADAIEEHGEPPSWRELARAILRVIALSPARDGAGS